MRANAQDYVKCGGGPEGHARTAKGAGRTAQRERCAAFAAQNGFAVAEASAEVETGKGSDALDRRPQLAAALAAARRLRCPVLVAKLDRLSANNDVPPPCAIPSGSPSSS